MVYIISLPAVSEVASSSSQSDMEKPFGNFPLPGSFTALLMGGNEDLCDESERPVLLHPRPGTLESLVPASVLTGGKYYHPRKRTFVDVPLQLQKVPRVEAEFMAALMAREGLKAPSKEVKMTRQQRVSEKLRCLGKLIPGEAKNMNTTTMLEEAYDYIKFMEAQVMVLNSMPVGSAGCEALEAVVNSPAVQAVLSSNKCCLVSMDQVELLHQVYLSSAASRRS